MSSQEKGKCNQGEKSKEKECECRCLSAPQSVAKKHKPNCQPTLRALAHHWKCELNLELLHGPLPVEPSGPYEISPHKTKHKKSPGPGKQSWEVKSTIVFMVVSDKGTGREDWMYQAWVRTSEHLIPLLWTSLPVYKNNQESYCHERLRRTSPMIRGMCVYVESHHGMLLKLFGSDSAVKKCA